MRLYGSLDNRVDEGKNYNKDKLIHENDDITMYHWSDRNCYYVTKVNSQKDIEVKKYEVCADHSKEGGMGHQNWMYFKTKKEHNEYINSFKSVLDEKLDEYPVENKPQNWVFRYGKWRQKVVYTLKDLESDLRYYLPEEDIKKIEDKGQLVKYYDLSGKISFGVRDFYYDYSF